MNGLNELFFLELHVMQMISMGTDLANTITDESPLTIAKVYFTLKTIVLVLEITKLSSGSRLCSFEISINAKGKAMMTC